MICILILTNKLPFVVFANEFVAPYLNASSAILIDAETGIVLHEKEAHTRRYPASLTKLMTSLMLLEHVNGDMDQRIQMSRYAVFSIPRGSSHIAMDEGETLSASEALYAIMLESANEVSNAIAEHVAYDVESFVLLMTERAHELGALNTNFTNAHGLHHPEHYTTAYDISLIMQELIKHPYFVDVISTRMFHIPPTERQPLERILNNTHRMIHPSQQFFNPYIVGGKTGFTNEASHTLSTYARRDNLGLIAVVMENVRHASFLDTEALVNFGFNLQENFKPVVISTFEQTLDVIQEIDGKELQNGTATVTLSSPFTVYLPPNISSQSISLASDLQDYISPPINAGEVLGTVTAMYGNVKLATGDLISQTNVPLVNVATNDIYEPITYYYTPLEVNNDTIFSRLSNFTFYEFSYGILTLDNVIIALLASLLLFLCMRTIGFVNRLLRKRHRRKLRSMHHRAGLQYSRQPLRGNTRYKYKR